MYNKEIQFGWYIEDDNIIKLHSGNEVVDQLVKIENISDLKNNISYLSLIIENKSNIEIINNIGCWIDKIK